ncbi:alkaline phosphatase family protein [Solidesulfovibrio sp.]|uniref:alkaline phosphatase family protein n=1 Tax=Solidesulfovibrio sp. TaxID=2910990 RepID=UPI002B200D50|nr:alkaline phosphatase family protein [Solidesulfovibrio sp.]MEA4858058.1 alkaline phosphatase family protein [Solidesulfovibrio sp.]
MTQPRKRLVVLGLDGLPLGLAQSLADTRRLPNLARLLDLNATTIEAELPELSPVNWTSVITAAGPGRHGVFGFVGIDPATYTLGPVDAAAIRVPTLMDRLTRAGLTAKIVNLPCAAPVKPLHGAIIAGFPETDLARAVFPPELAQNLRLAGYAIEADTSRGAADFDALARGLRKTLASRRAALEMLWAGGDFDFFMLVATETDRLFHFFFPAVAHPEHALHGAVLDLLADWDRLIGLVLDRYEALPEPKRLIALADHGFTELVTEVDLNVWLARKGLLLTNPGAQNEWDARIAPHQTAAFALDPGRIYINIKERFARGVFHEHVAEKLARELRDELLPLTHEGAPVMEAVYLAEEIYQGPQLRRAPNLVCLARPGYSLTAKFNRAELFSRHGRTGCHSAHGALYCDTAAARPGTTTGAGREIAAYFDLPEPNEPAWISNAI